VETSQLLAFEYFWCYAVRNNIGNDGLVHMAKGNWK